MDIELPVIEGEPNYWPDRAICPVCGQGKVLEPHSFAILHAGALLMDRPDDSGGPSDNLDGFLSLGWHGAHDDGQGDDRDIGCYLDIIRDARGGQADLYFCSTACLRTFMNQCVDKLEGRIKEEQEGLQQEN